MFSRSSVSSLSIIGALIAWLALAPESSGACVWKVTGPNGGTLYLGGSVHALRSTDYPLPSAYNRAFDASSRLVLEDDPKVSASTLQRFFRSGNYPKGDSLKNHLDPRTYDYLRRVFALAKVPEAKFAKVRPWMLITILWAPSTNQLGVEAFLIRRAHANGKPISGLESFREHEEIISGLSDHQAEMVLLITFIPQPEGSATRKRLMDAWHHGDADTIARIEHESSHDFPSFEQRLIGARNRNWIPKIEGYLKSGKTYFVVAGAAHMGGPEGVIALLKARGCRVEQI